MPTPRPQARDERRPLTIDDHRRIAAQVKAARALLAGVLTRLRNAHGETPPRGEPADNLAAVERALVSTESINLSAEMRSVCSAASAANVWRGSDVGALAWGRDEDGRRVALAQVDPAEYTLRTTRNTV